mgnify:CR=1 FL=1
MKKAITIILTAICLFSMMTITSAKDCVALNENKCCLKFNIQTQADLDVVYQGEDYIDFYIPVEFTITKNTPLSTNYDFVCWKDSNTGKQYYIGDKVIIDTSVILEAVWEEKDHSVYGLVNNLMVRFELIIKLISRALGLYNAYENSIPLTENNCKLIVNGNDITDQVYVMMDDDAKEVEVPYLAIIRELGAKTRWINQNLVMVSYEGRYEIIDSSDPYFGDEIPPGGGSYNVVRKRINDDLIFDLTSIQYGIRRTFGASITVDYNEKVIRINQGKDR